LWRTVKYEDIYLRDYLDVAAVIAGLREYFRFYNHERSHQALDYQTPAGVYFHQRKKGAAQPVVPEAGPTRDRRL